jgi:predicted alpha/beta hydrolase
MDWRKYGVYDLPAAVEEIQKRNGGAKVAYIGHSQGTTQTFAGIAQIPEWYDENISMSVLMGPCTSPNQKYFFDLYTQENIEFME